MRKFFAVRARLVGMASNESSGCIDCVGGAVDRAHGRPLGNRRVGADVAQIGGRIRAVVSLQSFTCSSMSPWLA